MALKIKFTFNGHDYFFRRPVLGNTNEIAFQRINRRTRGGDLVIFRDADWPKTETLGLTFNFFTKAELEEFQQFLKLTCGHYVHYTDHENRVWLGVIQNPGEDAAQPGRYTYQMAVTFEGDQV